MILSSADRLPFKDKAFDAVFSIEVIEHLSKEQGYMHIKEIERVCRGLVVITTPAHFFPQNSCESATQLMKHRSLWKPREFKRLGYFVEGLHPVRELIPPLLSRKFPYLACSILAFKVIKSE